VLRRVAPLAPAGAEPSPPGSPEGLWGLPDLRRSARRTARSRLPTRALPPCSTAEASGLEDFT